MDKIDQVQATARVLGMCCVPGKDTLLLQCLSPPKSINGYWQIQYRLKSYAHRDA